MNRYLILFALIFVLFFLLKLLKPRIKGFAAEKGVGVILHTLPRRYHVFSNVMLRTSNGTTQIDNVIISRKGIFVIETKSYTGTILGSYKDENWTKNVYGNCFPFRNPLRQNYGHTKSLEHLLGLSEDVFVPIVTFSGKVKLKVDAGRDIVIHTNRLKRTILSYKENVLSDVEVLKAIDVLKKNDVSDIVSSSEHVANIRRNQKEKEDVIKSGICPKCGARLVQREGKYGTFLACSNYPKCRFTINN